MSTEVIVLRAFTGDPVVAEELLAHGFAPGLLPTREGRRVAGTLLMLRKDGTVPSLENLRRALEERGWLGAGFRRYLVGLERMPCCSRLHAVAHLQMLKLDQVMARLDQVCERSLICAGLAGGPENGPNQGGAQAQERQPDVPSGSPSGARGGSGTGDGNGLRQGTAVARPRAEA